MTPSRRQTIAELRVALRATFLKLDPLGISDVPEAQDEYDELVGLAAARIAAGHDSQTIAMDIAVRMERSWGIPSSRDWIDELTEEFSRAAALLSGGQSAE